jgi:hypothetical protein
LDKFKLLKYYYGWSVKELYEEYVKNALEDYE